MGTLVSMPTVLTPKGQGTLPAPSPKPPSLLICTLELGLGVLLKVLSKSGGVIRQRQVSPLPDAVGSGCGVHGQQMTLRGSSPCACSNAVASRFPCLLTLHRFPWEAPEHVQRHPCLSPCRSCFPVLAAFPISPC